MYKNVGLSIKKFKYDNKLIWQMKIENQKINKHGHNWVSKLYYGIILLWSAKEFTKTKNKIK